MIRRPLVGAAVLCGALLLAACNGSPEAGRITPAPTAAGSSTTPAPTGPPTPSSVGTEEELSAITAAKVRYVAARDAVGKALSDPRKATRANLEAAGVGGQWLTAVIGQVVFQRDRGLYQTGSAKIVSTTVASVRLQLERPAIDLTNCIDGSTVVLRYRATGKPVPVGASSGARHKVKSSMVLAPSNSGAKMWFLLDEKVIGTC